MTEGIEPLHSPKLAAPGLDKIERFARRVMGAKVEGDEGEVTASNTNRRGLTRARRYRAKRAVGEHRKRNPFLSSFGRAAGGVRLGGCGTAGLVNGGAEDEVEVGQAQGAVGGLAAVDGLDIIDDLSSLHDGGQRAA